MTPQSGAEPSAQAHSQVISHAHLPPSRPSPESPFLLTVVATWAMWLAADEKKKEKIALPGGES